MNTSNKKISVVIISHNYGEYLPTCVQSILGQSVVPDEILVIDDASTDNTPDIAKLFRSRGVSYYKVNYQNLLLTRRKALSITAHDYICFLDADDYVDPLYIENGLSEFEKDYRIGIVYSDVRFFGHKNQISKYPQTSTEGFIAAENFIHSGSIFRRDAAEVAEAFHHYGPPERHEDWSSWRKILRMGFTGKKQKSLYYYRYHESNMSSRRHVGLDGYSYFESAALSEEHITLFTPLAGRVEMWQKYKTFLEKQHWDHKKINLILMDTSGNPAFSEIVKNWLITCDYSSFQYISLETEKKDLADMVRIDEHGNDQKEVLKDVRTTMARIYNHIRNLISTDYIWIIEDDVIPPLDACERLFKSFTHDTVSVTGAIPHRYEDAYIAWDEEKSLTEGEGVQKIKGNGFGCVLLRSEIYRNHVFTCSAANPDFDKGFYSHLNKRQYVKIDWSILCEHLSPRYTLQNGSIKPISFEEFDEEFYLEMNPDIKEAFINGEVSSPYDHYKNVGFTERRITRKTSSLKTKNRDIRSIEFEAEDNSIKEKEELTINIHRAGFEINKKYTPELIKEEDFDSLYYAQVNPDVLEAIQEGHFESPYEHYLKNGYSEERSVRKIPKAVPAVKVTKTTRSVQNALLEEEAEEEKNEASDSVEFPISQDPDHIMINNNIEVSSEEIPAPKASSTKYVNPLEILQKFL